eukprot:6236968-Pyramimonas_sp.AAC.3
MESIIRSVQHDQSAWSPQDERGQKSLWTQRLQFHLVSVLQPLQGEDRVKQRAGCAEGVHGNKKMRRQRITPLFHSSGAVRIQKAWVRSRTRRLSCFAMSQAVVRYTDGQLLGIANSVIPKHFQGAVEPIWVAAISKVESEGDPYAYRYEAHIDDAST